MGKERDAPAASAAPGADTPEVVLAAGPMHTPLRRALEFVAAAIMFAGVTFLGAGTLRWSAGWVTVALALGGLIAQDVYVRRRNPGLMERRQRRGRGAPWWDRLIIAYSQICTMAIFFVAGWTAGRQHAGFPPLPVWLGGLALWAVGMGLTAWAMASNGFFEGTIRLQADVGHRVVSHGPYAHIRHPGYAGVLIFSLALPLLFGAPAALIPAGLELGWLLPRTILEDRFLRANLPGYAAYARRVRWRWLPGVW